ncbi:MAG: hypothetical protein HY719_03770 [Planctomycetes bacterium]|nr:hypothetical protein [Planctomycetota bacterium]
MSILERLLAAYPEAKKPDVLARLRKSKDMANRVGAEWELVVFGLLRGMGYDVKVKPERGSGEGNPDFLVTTRNDVQFYCEGTVAHPSEEYRRRYDTFDAFKKHVENSGLADTNYLVCIVDEDGATCPDFAGFDRWFSGAFGRHDGGGGPHLGWIDDTWVDGGWAVKVSANCMRDDCRKGASPVVILVPPAAAAEGADRIKAAIRAKANRYNSLDKPLVVAVLYQDEHSCVSERDVHEAVFGTERIHGARYSDGHLEVVGHSREPDGAWHRSHEGELKNTRISAAFVCAGLDSDTRFPGRTWFVHHPKANHPLPREAWLMAQIAIDPAKGTPNSIPGRSLEEVLHRFLEPEQ